MSIHYTAILDSLQTNPSIKTLDQLYKISGEMDNEWAMNHIMNCEQNS